MSPKTPQIGDVIEIATPKGLAYAQYTHYVAKMGAVLRVLNGIFPVRPASFKEIVRGAVRFTTMFPLGAACNRGIVQVVSNEEIPESVRAFPLFKRRGDIDPGGHVRSWVLWDGQREWAVRELTPEQKNLPTASIWNDTLLVERIISGWTSAEDVR